MEIVILILKVLFVFQTTLALGSLCTWIERKGSALIQDRVGANRAGAFYQSPNALLNWTIMPFVRLLGGLGVINTLLCDAVKGVFKEDFIPEGTSRFLHGLAPFMATVPIFLAFGLIPLAPTFTLGGYEVATPIARLDAGILFIMAMGSLSVYGVALAGWGGNNKFSLLGGLRAAAQMISYELAMGVAFASVILVYGTLDLYSMVDQQKGFAWGVVTQPLTFVILFIVGMAETKRAPFDMPESESELVAGYFTEYSGMKFLLFWLGEFCEIALFSLLVSILFFGGWHLPFLSLPEGWWLSALIGHLILMGKVVFFCTLQIVIRWTLPRFRYDQLMDLGWKYLLPLSLVNLMITAAIVLMRHTGN